ncbi:MAG: GNAT family N-acetyltransferase [Cyanobacteria bacterium P01_A01_bin.15]
MLNVVFETDRLCVRRWREADLPALMAVYGDGEAMKWVDDGQPITHEECVKWLEVTRANYGQRGYGMFAVERRSAPGVIGCCGIVHPSGQKEAEVKYAYLRSWWGQGIATEALIGLINYGVAKHKLNYIMATAAPENVASHRVLLKAGMRRGALRHNEDGTYTQVFEYLAAS